MADDPILQNAIVQPGQSQDERLPRELDVHFADVDERTPDALLAYARALTKIVPFVKPSGPGPEPARVTKADGWKPFFDAPAAGEERGAAPALYDAFLHLYNHGPRQAINRLTERHLDFLYEQVLGFRRNAAIPDRAHAILTLKKGSLPVQVTPSHRFSGGKDAAGVEQFYAPTTEVIVNTSQIASLRSIYVDPLTNGKVHVAPTANSIDGLGGALPEDAPGWTPFGHAGLPVADAGFALASSVLLMQEGQRKITVRLAPEVATSLTTAQLAGAFEAFLTGKKQWLGPLPVSATLNTGSGELTLVIDVDVTVPAITGYDAAVHAQRYTTAAPVLQVLLKANAPLAYNDLSAFKVKTAAITVDVEKLTALTLESDAGSLDPKKAFLPFGPLPAKGSRFVIGCDEALSKSLSRLDLTLQWKGAPKSLSTHYTGYTPTIGSNNAFTVSTVFRDRASEHTSTEGLFDSADATAPKVIKLLSSADAPATLFPVALYVYALQLIGTTWGQSTASQQVATHRLASSFLQQPPESRTGVVILTLNSSFLHAEFRQQSVAKIIEKIAKPNETTLLNEPYTPTLQGLSLGYTAHTAAVNVSSTEKEDFAQLDVQFFHVGPFGERRDHGHQRLSLGFVDDTKVPLVQPYPHQGELLIGVSGLKAGDSVSLLFQVAEGSANPDIPAQRPAWAVLCDNYWKPLEAEGIVRDTTNLLLTSGVVGVVIPAQATTTNTLLDPGLIWLKASVPQHADAASRLVDVVANAVEVQRVIDAKEATAAYLSTALPAGSIAKLTTPIAPVSKVKQPYPSFGGRPRETGDRLRTRAAERLRHKDRAITQWDYERLVLGAFPSVHRAKCIPHASATSWMAPGHVTVVVVPDLRNQNAPDRLRPKVDADTLVRIQEFLAARAPGPVGRDRPDRSVSILVKNPAYQRLRVSCLVKFHTGREFNFHRAATVDALIRVLSPWAFDESRTMRFGGRVYASTLLNFIEELPYVDYVTDFKLLTDDKLTDGDVLTLAPVEHADPLTPDAILVSDENHDIGEVPS